MIPILWRVFCLIVCTHFFTEILLNWSRKLLPCLLSYTNVAKPSFKSENKLCYKIGPGTSNQMIQSILKCVQLLYRLILIYYYICLICGIIKTHLIAKINRLSYIAQMTLIKACFNNKNIHFEKIK